MFYRIKLTPDTNGTLLATCAIIPEFAAAVTDVSTLKQDCIELMLLALSIYIEKGITIPTENVNIIFDESCEILELEPRVGIILAMHNECVRGGISRETLARITGTGKTRINKLFDFNRVYKTKIYSDVLKAIVEYSLKKNNCR